MIALGERIRKTTKNIMKLSSSPIDQVKPTHRSMLQVCQTLCGPRDVAQQVPLSKELLRQEYWSRLPFSIPGNLPDPGIKPVSLCLLH